MRKEIIGVNINSFASHITRFCGSRQEAIKMIEYYQTYGPKTSIDEVYRQISDGNSTAKPHVSEYQHNQDERSLKRGHWK